MKRVSIREQKKLDSLHLKAPDNWINDPNGFIYYNDQYHLFYQYFPYGPRWGTMHWGHAVSRDLVEWEHLGIALYPSKKGDQNGCFSGSAVEKDGSLFLLYTGVRYLVVDPEDIHVCLDGQMEACTMMISSDDGFHFDNECGKTMVIPPGTDPTISSAAETRDPKVWRGEHAWYMIQGTLDESGAGKNLIYESADLKTWKLKQSCAHRTIRGAMGECPDYFEVDGQGILCYSVMGYAADGKTEPNQLVMMKASFDEPSGMLTAEPDHRLLDHGMDLYAAQSTTDEEERRIQISWLRMPKPTKEGWIGMMSLPRVISVEDGQILTDVHPNVRAAFSEIPADARTDLADMAGARITADLHEGSSISVYGYKLSYINGCIITDRSHVFPEEYKDRWRMIHKSPELSGSCSVEIYVEDHVIEVYINKGQHVITNAVYELRGGVTGENVEDLQVFPLK